MSAVTFPRDLDRWLTRVYGKAGDGDRADWSRRAAAAFLVGEPFTETMPRDRHHVTDGRLEGIRRAVAEVTA